MDCRPPGSSIHGIFQARVLEWVAISFSRGSSSNPGLLHCRQMLYCLSYQGADYEEKGASRCLMPKVFQKDNVDLSQKPPQFLCCVRLSGFTFPLLRHFHCSNQRPFPLGLSTVEIENSWSPVLRIVGALCALGHQVFRVTSSTWRGHRGGEF